MLTQCTHITFIIFDVYCSVASCSSSCPLRFFSTRLRSITRHSTRALTARAFPFSPLLLSSLPYHSSLPFFLPFVSFRSVPFRSLHCTALHCICAALRRTSTASAHLISPHFTSLQCRVSEIGRDWQRNGFVRADHEAYSCPPSRHRSLLPLLSSQL